MKKKISHEVQVVLDGPAHKCCMIFPTVNICVVIMKSDFFLSFHKNTLACIFTSLFYLCLNKYVHFYISLECLADFSFQNILLAKNVIKNVGEPVYIWIWNLLPQNVLHIFKWKRFFYRIIYILLYCQLPSTDHVILNR